MRRKGDQVKLLDSRDRDDMVITGGGECRSARSNRSWREWGGVNRNKVRDWAHSEQGPFESHGSRSSSNNADAVAETSAGALRRLSLSRISRYTTFLGYKDLD